MRQFTISAAAMAFAALLASVPAQAEAVHGAPMKNGNQCFNFSPSQGGLRDSRFGYWGACPQAASTTAAASRTTRRAKASR